MAGFEVASRLPRRFPKRLQWLARAGTFLFTYAAWVCGFRLLVLTFVTYFVVSSTSRSPRFEDISEALGSAELTLMGVCAFLYVLFLRSFNPITATTSMEIFTPARIERRFVPGFLHGSLLASGVVLAFLLSGTHSYLGAFLQFEETPLALLNVALRVLALSALVYFEEFIFRHKIVRHLRNFSSGGHPVTMTLSAEIGPALTSAFCYCLVKQLQFDLGLMQWITLFLVSLALSVRNLGDGGDFTRGAGFWAAILIVFQPLLSLPVFGTEFTGLILVKYQGLVTDNPGLAAAATTGTARFISGGAGGPLSSFAFQLLLLLDIFRGAARYSAKHKKALLMSGVSQLN